MACYERERSAFLKQMDRSLTMLTDNRQSVGRIPNQLRRRWFLRLHRYQRQLDRCLWRGDRRCRTASGSDTGRLRLGMRCNLAGYDWRKGDLVGGLDVQRSFLLGLLETETIYGDFHVGACHLSWLLSFDSKSR